MVRSERKMGAALPTIPIARLSKAEWSKRTNGSIRLAFLLVLLALTALSVYQSVAFRGETQYVETFSSFDPPKMEPETTKKLEEEVEVADLSPPENKSKITEMSAEKVKVSKPLQQEAGNSIESEPEGKQEKDAASASVVAYSKSDASANLIPIRAAANIPASAPVPASASAPTSNLSPNPDRVFWCGYLTMFGDLPFNLAKELFPGVPAEMFNLRKMGAMEFGSNDLLLKTRSGRCWLGKGNPKIEKVFPGKIMYVVGESEGPSPFEHERIYSLGPLADSNKTIRAYFGAMVLGMAKPENQRKIFDPRRRVKNTKKKFVSYIASNCVEFREKAFTDLSNIGAVHYGGRCSGLKGGNGTIIHTNVGGSWMRNHRGVFQDYRFGLVMENKKHDGYITEKIVNAYLSGGTVPIWYGTREIFDVFNERAFIYYDIEDPQPALDRIAYLEKNQTAYDEVRSEPILANGDQTIEDYFSFRDDVGGGKLKKRIRNMLGYQ
jgi:hypothetical protein